MGKDPCPGRSQHKCEHCGKCHDIFEVCELAPPKFPAIIQVDTALTARQVYDEIGKLKWTGVDASWDDAIEAVRSYIKENM